MPREDVNAHGDAGADAWRASAAADNRTLRNLFGTFLTGVTIVTFRDAQGAPRGFTANSFTSVSLDPPLILVCVARSAGSYDELCRTDCFAVNVLSDAQRKASMEFGSRTGKRFEEVVASSVEGGTPVIEGSLSTMMCTRVQVVDAGDHAIVVGRVQQFRTGAGQPLGYYRGGYVAFELAAAALDHLGSVALRIGCLVEFGNRVMLVRRAGHENWEIPSLPFRAGENHQRAVPRLLSHLGVKAEIGFLYSVYQQPGEPHTTLIFRAVAEEQDEAPAERPDGLQIGLFSAESAPWNHIPDPSQQALLRRFFAERAQDRFGIYWGTEDGGRVAAIVESPRRWPAGQQGQLEPKAEIAPESGARR